MYWSVHQYHNPIIGAQISRVVPDAQSNLQNCGNHAQLGQDRAEQPFDILVGLDRDGAGRRRIDDGIDIGADGSDAIGSLLRDVLSLTKVGEGVACSLKELRLAHALTSHDPC